MSKKTRADRLKSTRGVQPVQLNSQADAPKDKKEAPKTKNAYHRDTGDTVCHAVRPAV
jgi:hypothetical protein